MFDPKTSPDTPNAISSPASADGATPCDSPVGQTLDLFGPEAVPASLSAPPASSKAQKTTATSGQSSSGSSASVALTRYLASRLQTRLATTGSTMFRQTWKEKVTPSGRSYWAHTASVPRTSGSGCGSWVSPNAGPQNDGDTTWQQRRVELKEKHWNGNGFGMTLGQAVTLSSWATPTVPMQHDSDKSAFRWNPNKKQSDPVNQILGRSLSLSDVPTENRGQLNPAFSRWLMGYPPGWDDCAAMVTPLSLRRPRK